MWHSAGTQRTSAHADFQEYTRHPTASSAWWWHITPAVSQLRAASHSPRWHSSRCQASLGGFFSSKSQFEPRTTRPGLSIQEVLAGPRRFKYLHPGHISRLAGHRCGLCERQPSIASWDRANLARPDLRQARHRRCGSNRDPHCARSERRDDQLRARTSWALRSARLSGRTPRRIYVALTPLKSPQRLAGRANQASAIPRPVR